MSLRDVFFPLTQSDNRYPDGGYRYLPPDDSHQRLPSEIVSADWQSPEDVAELLNRVYPEPEGAPEAWVKFFAGQDIEDAERDKIRVELKKHAQKPSDSGSIQDQKLLRARQEIERDLQNCSWLNTETEADHWKVINNSAETIAQAVSKRAALQMQRRLVEYLFELNRDEIRARVDRAHDLHLLWLLFSAITTRGPHASFPEEYLRLLPAETVRSIEWYREWDSIQAEAARRAREAQALKQIEEEEREKIERLAAVEVASFDELLDLLFGHNPNSSILESFRRREKLTSTQLDVLIDLKDTLDPVRRRGHERLIQLGASVGIAVLTLEEIEELEGLRATRLREEEEKKEREAALAISQITDWQPPAKRGGTAGAVGMFG